MSYGVLSLPKLDEYQTEYVNCGTDRLWAVSSSVSDEQLEKIGYVCEALSCYNYNIVIPAYFNEVLKGRYADSSDDADMLDIIRDTRTIGFAFAYDLALNNIFESGGKSENFASYIAKYKKGAEISLKNLLAKLEDLE